MTYFEAYKRKKGLENLNESGYPAGCVVKYFGVEAQADFCNVVNSKKRCADCWERDIGESVTKKPRKPNNAEKPVYEIDENGNVVKRWKSLVQASRNLRINHVELSKICRGQMYYKTEANTTFTYGGKYAKNCC